MTKAESEVRALSCSIARRHNGPLVDPLYRRAGAMSRLHMQKANLRAKSVHGVCAPRSSNTDGEMTGR